MAKTPQLIVCEVGTTDDPALPSYSPFVLKVHRALQLAGLPYTSEHRQKPIDWNDLNPAGQVPVLKLDGDVVIDSTDILKRIAALRPDAFDAKDVEAQLWEEMADSDLNAFLIGARWGDDESWQRTRPAFFGPAPDAVVLPMRERVAGSVSPLRRGQVEFRRQFLVRLAQLDKRAPKNGYWCTPHPSVADLAIFAQLHSLRSGLTPWYRDQVTSFRNLARYLDRIQTLNAPQKRNVQGHQSPPA